MAKDDKLEPTEELLDEEDLVSRRDFLVGLGKWSQIVIGLALLGGTIAIPGNDAAARTSWANRIGGGSWANRRGGGGWANRRGGGGWANRRGGGGWANRRGGGGWLNVR
jgi:hypothetical protein